MTKEEIIDNIARLNSETWKDREEVRTEIGKLLVELNKALEQQPSEDCVSRKFMYELGATCIATRDKNDKLIALGTIEDLPSATPTHCIAEVRFSKEDLREICNERIEIECTHGTCKDCVWWDSENNIIGYCNACKHWHGSSRWDIGIYRKTKADFYCADFEKRGNENG